MAGLLGATDTLKGSGLHDPDILRAGPCASLHRASMSRYVRWHAEGCRATEDAAGVRIENQTVVLQSTQSERGISMNTMQRFTVNTLAVAMLLSLGACSGMSARDES